MQIRSIKKIYGKGLVAQAAAVLFIFIMITQTECVQAEMKSPPPDRVKVIMIGDRVVDVAYNLGVLPVAMSVRGSLWPMAKQFKAASRILGCPRCIVIKKKTVPLACRKYGVHRLIVEKSTPFCLYKPEVKPENIVPIMAGEDVTIEYVDFSDGLEQAVRRTAKLLGRESRADGVIEKYQKALAAAKSKLRVDKTRKKVIVFNGIYQPSSGKSMLRVEAPGGYADQFLLSPLGYVNAGDCFRPTGGKPQKGHYPVRKRKGGFVLDPLINADPDVIIMTGDSLAFQKALIDCRAANPALARIKAVRDTALYTLPRYVDSGVLEYPFILRKWAKALSR
jgi:hypothetical protein